MMGHLANSRFNPKPGILDFWNEIRKPTPYRWPILFVSTLPFAVILYWLSGETVYKTPERPQITYVTSFEPDRTDEEIMASNIENQEIKELREQEEEALAQRKRDLYKALGAVAGMDVEEIDRRGEEARARAEAERQAELDQLMGRTSGEVADAASGETSAASESSAP
ncbi:MAG: hypothetical protein ACX930_15730 [Erythrobacter sp.]